MPVKGFRLSVQDQLGGHKWLVGGLFGAALAIVTTALWLLSYPLFKFVPYQWVLAPVVIWFASELVGKAVFECQVVVSETGISVHRRWSPRIIRFADIASRHIRKGGGVLLITLSGEEIVIAAPALTTRARRRAIEADFATTLGLAPSEGHENS